MFANNLITVWWCVMLLGSCPAPASPQATRDSAVLVRLAGGAAEMANSLLDMLWRRPSSQSRTLGGGAAEVYQAQRGMPSGAPFMCDTRGARSPTPPASVHRLRPGDIDVVAAMGDSLTAGNGPMAHDLARLVINNRGLSWTIGGQGDWRRFLTLPNILKEFNPRLIGFSTGDGYSYSRVAGFNVAVSGAITPDLPHQARVLVRRMSNDPRVNMTHHWKLVSILVGSNDICLFACYNASGYSGRAHASHLRNALDYLYTHVPRVYVNLVMQPELSVLRSMPNKPLMCSIAHRFECPCMFGAYADSKEVFSDKMVVDYRREEIALVSSGRYDNRSDFAVEMQPFTEYAMTSNMKQQHEMDMRLFAIDCFHLSQKGNAYAANALWNNMLEADGNKSRTWRPEFEQVLCPTSERPFLFTRRNSELFLSSGKQFEESSEAEGNEIIASTQVKDIPRKQKISTANTYQKKN